MEKITHKCIQKLQAGKENCSQCLYDSVELCVCESQFKDTHANGGSTYTLKGDQVSSGYAVAIYPKLERQIQLDKFTVEDLTEYKREVLQAGIDPNNICIGTWLNAYDNRVYLDVSEIRYSKGFAIRTAKELNQIAIYDIGNKTEIRI